MSAQTIKGSKDWYLRPNLLRPCPATAFLPPFGHALRPQVEFWSSALESSSISWFSATMARFLNDPLSRMAEISRARERLENAIRAQDDAEIKAILAEKVLDRHLAYNVIFALQVDSSVTDFREKWVERLAPKGKGKFQCVVRDRVELEGSGVVTGNYELSRLESKVGATADVWIATHTSRKARAPVAVKIYGDDYPKEKVQHEFDRLMDAAHDGVLAPIAVGSVQSGTTGLVHPCLVLKTLAERKPRHGGDGDLWGLDAWEVGTSLTHVLEQSPEKKLSPKRVFRILESLLTALSWCNASAELLHRDVKPGNIIVLKDRVALIDFGLVHDSLQSAFAGTLKYAAPETARSALEMENTNESAYDARSEVFAAALVAVRMLTGTTPYLELEESVEHGLSVVDAPESLLQIVVGPRNWEEQLMRAVGRTTWRRFRRRFSVLLHALAYQPSDRYQSSERFLDDLRRAGSGAYLSIEKAIYARVRRWWRLSLVVLVLVPLLSFLSFEAWSASKDWEQEIDTLKSQNMTLSREKETLQTELENLQEQQRHAELQMGMLNGQVSTLEGNLAKSQGALASCEKGTKAVFSKQCRVYKNDLTTCQKEAVRHDTKMKDCTGRLEKTEGRLLRQQEAAARNKGAAELASTQAETYFGQLVEQEAQLRSYQVANERLESKEATLQRCQVEQSKLQGAKTQLQSSLNKCLELTVRKKSAQKSPPQEPASRKSQQGNAQPPR